MIWKVAVKQWTLHPQGQCRAPSAAPPDADGLALVLPSISSWASGAPPLLTSSFHFSVAWARYACGLVEKAASFFLQVNHTLTLEVGRERKCGVCPYGFQYHLFFPLDIQLFFPSSSPADMQPLGLPQNQTKILLKTFPPAPTIHIINPLFHITQSGSTSPITP